MLLKGREVHTLGIFMDLGEEIDFLYFFFNLNSEPADSVLNDRASLRMWLTINWQFKENTFKNTKNIYMKSEPTEFELMHNMASSPV